MLDIIQGEKQPWSMTITTKNAATGKVSPLDLTGFSEITVCFLTAQTHLITKTQTGGGVTVDNAVLGEISGDLLTTDTDAMPEGFGDIEAQVDFGSGDVRKAIIVRSHKVTKKLC